MKCALSLTAAVIMVLATPIDRPAAQTSSQPAAQDATKGPLNLSEQQKAAVIQAAIGAKTHQKTPEGFTPAVGASVPHTVFDQAFNPEITREMPILKIYWYSYLDREIVLTDGIKKQVVAVIPLPAKYMIEDQKNQGAAEPATTESAKPATSVSKDKDAAGPTGSVPAYTSPETLK
jgi:hypothetical protein